MTDDILALGPTLQALRRTVGLTQEELAERAGVSARTVSDVERGVRPSVYRDTATRLGAALGLVDEELRRFERMARRGPHQLEATAGVAGLPVSPTALIGRERELAQILGVLADPSTQLLTLTGPGGIGKSRLAVEAAGSARSLFPDGVTFVSLAGERDPALFVQIMLRSIGADRAHGRDLEALVHHLKDMRVLIVLDTFEHLIDAAPTLATVLAACPGVSALVTSRSTLRLRAGSEMTVTPLEVETDERSGPPPAVALFLDRAREAVPELDVTDRSTLAAVAEICRRVEGVPLAIELAAARVKHLPISELGDRLEHRLPILTGGPRDATPRQQTMRDTIAWSYELLDVDRRSFLRALSAFDGGWGIAAAGAVADLAEHEALSAISALVDASLAWLVATDGGAARYRMLDVVGEFAAERAADEGEADTFARRHAAYFLALAEAAEPDPGAVTQGAWHRRLEPDLGNLRAAMRWAREHDRVDVALRLAAALWQFWRLYGGFTEGRRWLETAIAMEGSEETEELPKALWGAAWLAYHQDDFTRAGSLGDRLVGTARERGLPLDERNGLTVLGMVAVADARLPEALELFRRSVEISTIAGASWHLATSLFNLGQVTLLAGDRREAERLWKDALSRYRELGDEHFAARLEGHLGYLPLLDGDLEAAGTRFAASLDAFGGLGDEWGVAEALERCAALAASRSQDQEAATIAGAAEVLRERLAARPMPFDRVMLEPYLAGSRARLGADVWREHAEQGRGTSLETAIDLALVAAGSPEPA